VNRERRLQHEWWDPALSPVTKGNDLPAVALMIRFDPTRQQGWILEQEIDRAAHRAKTEIRRLAYDINPNEMFRCTAIAWGGDRCVLYTDHVVPHRFDQQVAIDEELPFNVISIHHKESQQ
jgi:hypothetical protein